MLRGHEDHITICIAMQRSINPIFKFKKKVAEEYTQYNVYTYMYVYMHF